MAELNERVKIARIMSGMTQDELAKGLGVQRSVSARYEQEIKPTDGYLKKIAKLTGFPVEWFWSEPITGILVLTPERPGVSYSPPQLRIRQQSLDVIWPKTIGRLGLEMIVFLQCHLGGVMLAYSKTVCLVVIGTHSINTLLRISSCSSIKPVVMECSTEDFLNCWMQPAHSYLKTILGYAGPELDFASKTIENGHPQQNQENRSISLNMSLENSTISPDDLLSIICEVLSRNGIKIITSDIKSSVITVPGAPDDWKFCPVSAV